MTIIRVEYEGSIYDLDVLNDSPIRVDISAIENDAIGEVFGAASQNFTLPGSRRNNRFFKHAYKTNSLDVPALNESVRATVITDSDTMLEGSMFLEEVSRLDDGSINYEVIVTNDVVSFNEKIKTRRLVDLDWSFYNHRLSVQNITSSWDGSITNINGDTITGSIFYPLIDMGSDGTETTASVPLVQLDTSPTPALGFMNNPTSSLQVQQFTPAMSIKLILDTIFDDAGFAYSSSLEPFFENLYHLPKQTEDLTIKGTEISGFNFVAEPSSSQTYTASADFVTVQFENTTLNEGGAYDTTTDIYTIPRNGTYQFQTTLNYAVPIPADPIPFVQARIINETTGDILGFTSFVAPQPQGFISVETNEVNLTAGDEISVGYSYIQSTGGTTLSSTLFTTSNFLSLKTPLNFELGVVNLGNQFDVQSKCIDIIKGLVEKFNLVIEPVYEENRLLKIENYTDWIKSGVRKDWTSKVQRAKKITTKSPLSSQPKTITFEDVKDNDKLSKQVIDDAEGLQWGTEIIDAVSDTPQGERKVGFYFAPVILERLSGGNANNVIPQLYKTDNSQVERKTFKFKPRLGYKVNDSLSQTAYIGTGSIPFTDYATISNYENIPVTQSQTDNLHFNDTLYPPTFTDVTGSVTAYTKYWGYYVDELYSNENRILNVDLEFFPDEIRDIKLNDKIFIEDSVYRINKIRGFNLVDRDVVNVDLITVQDTGFVSQSVPPITPPVKHLELNITNNTTQSLDYGIIGFNFNDDGTRQPIMGGIATTYFYYISASDIPTGTSQYTDSVTLTGDFDNSQAAVFTVDPDVNSTAGIYVISGSVQTDEVEVYSDNSDNRFYAGLGGPSYFNPIDGYETISLDITVDYPPAPPSPTKHLELNITNNTTESLDEAFLIFNIDDTGTRQEGTGPFDNYYYYISQSAVPTGFTQYTGSIFLTQSFQSSPQDAFRFSTRPDVPSQFIYSITASLQKDDVEFLELNDPDGLFNPTAATILNPTESFATFSIDVTVDYSSSITPPETGSIEVASILLANGSCLGGENPTGSFDGRMFVTASWNGFTTDGSGKLVLNNGISFNGVDTPTIDPSDPNVIVVSESVDFPISTELLTLGDTYLIHVDSLVNPIDDPGDKIETTVDLSATASFTSCEL